MKQWASLGDGCILRVEQPNVSSILMWSTPSQRRRVSRYWRCSALPQKGAPAEAAVCSMNPHFCVSIATDRRLQIQCVCGSFISASSAQWNDAGSREACAASCQTLLCDWKQTMHKPQFPRVNLVPSLLAISESSSHDILS